jgi:PAS domain S-box-containing protein
MVRGKVFKLKSARGQALLAGAVLLVLLVGVAALAVWRAQNDRTAHRSLESRASVVAALDDARAQFFLNTTLLATAAFSQKEDRASFADKYYQRRSVPGERLAEARAGLVALGESEDIDTLDTVAGYVEQLQRDLDVAIDIAIDANPETVVQMGAQAQQELWPRFETILIDLEQLADGQRSKLAAERAAAETASETTFGLLIGLSLLAFLGAFAMLGMFIVSLLRPLASLQASARAITSGSWEARAKVSGPEETASLARDFNEMTETLVERSALLEESEGRFRNVLEVSRDLIYKLNVETGTYDYVSPSVLRLTGFTPEEFIAMGFKGVAERAHPEDKILLDMPFRMLLKLSSEDSSVAQVEYRWKHKDGEYLWASDSRSLIRDENGRAIALVGTVRDETKRKQAEEALRESEERFRSLSASAPIGIFLTDAQGNAVYANEHLLELGGVTFEEGLAHTWIRLIHPDDREAVLAAAARAPAEQRDFSREFRILTKAGEERWVHTTATAILSPEGVITGLVGTVEDITERKAAEEALRESEEKYRDLFENASDLIQSVAADGPFVYVNPAWRETLGYSEEEIGGLSFMDIIHPDSKAHCAELFERVMAGERVDHIEAMFVTKEGKTIAVEGSAGGTVKDGEIVGTRGIFRDISERQRAEEERRKAYESIVLLLATAAEARDPYTEDHLYRIRGFAEAIAAELGLPPDEIREIGLSSLLHDLGKMRVPDSILTKPGPLSQAEWKIMKQHPLWGEELLSAHPWLETARQIARWHHERWDGTGYPDGLRAERIPLSAAIVTVADALDAMISERPYKGAWPQQQAVREIRMQKGRHFSPDVVEAFNRALRKGEIKRVTDATLRLSKPARAA